MTDQTKPNPNCRFCQGQGIVNLFEDTFPCPDCWNYPKQTGNKSVNHSQLIEMVIGLQSALQIRNDCPDCGGKGIHYVDDGHGDVDAEPCNCHIDAWDILDRYLENFELVVDEYLWQNGYDPAELTKEFNDRNVGLLEKIKEQIK